VAVGAIRALGPDDAVCGTHRSHHLALAKGITPRTVMAELFGRVDGCAGGRGGSMHLVDGSVHFLGANGIVGAGLGVATGAALAFHMRRQPAVSVGFFGDGGSNTGRVWENLNLAAIWKLPLVAVCENNRYAVETSISYSLAGGSISRRAEGFGLPTVTVDGQDVVAVHRAMAGARERALRGEGPTFIEALTYRYEGHNVGDRGSYRTKSEIEEWRAHRDPVQRVRRALIDHGVIDEAGADRLVAETAEVVEDAIRFADASPWPTLPPVDVAARMKLTGGDR
jgi:TPP-dependent pyruvate/acetoin dehydrogenase alpha subunit